VPERRVFRLGARGPGGRGRGRVCAVVVAAGAPHRAAAWPCPARRRGAGRLVMAVIERDAKIVNPLGMHARPAAEFVKLASRFKSAVEVRKDDLAVNGKSIMGVMMLAAECGSSLTIKTDGEDAESAMAALLALVADGFHEMHLTEELREVPHRVVPRSQVEKEVRRLRAAVKDVKRYLQDMRAKAEDRAGVDEARIFDAQILMLEDKEFLSGVADLIRENHLAAEKAYE